MGTPAAGTLLSRPEARFTSRSASSTRVSSRQQRRARHQPASKAAKKDSNGVSLNDLFVFESDVLRSSGSTATPPPAAAPAEAAAPSAAAVAANPAVARATAARAAAAAAAPPAAPQPKSQPSGLQPSTSGTTTTGNSSAQGSGGRRGQQSSVRRIAYPSSRDTMIRSTPRSVSPGRSAPDQQGAGGGGTAAATPPPSLAFMGWGASADEDDEGGSSPRGGPGAEGSLGTMDIPGSSVVGGGPSPFDNFPNFGAAFQGGRLFDTPPLLQLAQQQPQQQRRASSLQFAEPDEPAVLEIASQEAAVAAAARLKELPPLQSVVELTTAWKPPQRMGQETEEDVAEAAQASGMSLPEGSGVLADGTTYERTSGQERGPNGWWCKWHQISGSTADGVKWCEKWWEISDWSGAREMGAEKSGTAADGSHWVEKWVEAFAFDAATGQPTVERTAHKSATDSETGNQWEEKWGERYSRGGWANKYADKWGREGENVWHEKWGEEYDGQGGCVKYTDKWAEKLDATGAYAVEKWGDKWEERFSQGRGTKTGEVWRDGGEGSYNRYWGEDHLGEGWVRKHGHSTTGENWDFTEQSGTHYNPIPHFDYELALKHSPQLLGVPMMPRPEAGVGEDGKPVDEDNPFGGGIDSL